MGLESRFPQIVADAERKVAEAVDSAGRRIESGARARARVDTGQMRGEIQWHHGPGPYEGEVIAGARHTVFNEYGTRHMSAQPMLGPATEDAREPFLRDLRDAYKVT